VDDLLLVQVLERAAELFEALRGVFLGVAALGDDAVEELAARHELHHEVHLLGLVEDLEEVDHVRVVDVLHDLDLARDVPHVLHLRLVDDLDRDLLGDLAVLLLVDRLLHDGKVPRAELVANLVVLLEVALLEEAHVRSTKCAAGSPVGGFSLRRVRFAAALSALGPKRSSSSREAVKAARP